MEMSWNQVIGLSLGIIGGVLFTFGAVALDADYKDRLCDDAWDVDVGITMCMDTPGCFFDADDFVALRVSEQATARCKVQGWKAVS